MRHTRAAQPHSVECQLYRGKPIGDECDAAIRQAAKGSEVVVAAWGNHGGLLGRDRQVVSMLRSLKCVGTTMKGAPRHPLYVRSDQPLEPYEGG